MFHLSNFVSMAMGILVASVGITHAASPVQQVTIVGKATFEKRSTVVPFEVCEPESKIPCAHSREYWALTIRTPSVMYELNEMFAVGTRFKPEHIEVADVTIRPGTQLVLEGSIHVISDRFAIITQVESINLVMDHSPDLAN